MRFTTPDLCDEFPAEVRVLAPILRSFGGREAFSGPAVTASCHEDDSVVEELVGTPDEGRVIVVDGGGSLRTALLGDTLGRSAADQGWAGLVVFGCVRDVELLRGIDVGVCALAAMPVRSAKRGAGDCDIPVSFGGVRFAPGDHVDADANGIVVADRSRLG